MEISAAGATRDERILALHSLAVAIAREVHHLVPSIDVRDLIQSGMLGATQAVDRHDPARAPLHIYARARIRGAMLHDIGVLLPGGSDEDLVEAKPAQRIEIGDALERLPARQRKVIELRQAGHTQEEVATKLGVTRQSVSRLEMRGYWRIERQYQPKVLRAA